MVSVRDREKSIIIDPEQIAKGKLSEPAHFVYQYNISDKDKGLNTFLILPSRTLNQFAPLLVKAIRKLPNLRVVFLFKYDNKLDTFLDYVRALDKNVRSKVFDVLCPVDSVDQINEVMNAWCDGSEDERIARASLQDGKLSIVTYGMKTLPPIDFSDIPALKKIPLADRGAFKIDKHGRKLSWAGSAVEIDLDIVRYHTDPMYRRRKVLNSLKIYSSFGSALKTMREKLELTQEQVTSKASISTKQLSRLENGNQPPTEKMMIKLAKAHGLSYEEYTRSLLKLCDQLQVAQIKSGRIAKAR